MTDKIDGFCTVAHYGLHIQPILDAIPDERRGTMYAPRPVDAELRALGIPCIAGTAPSPSRAPLLVGGYQDLRYGRRPKVYCAHGAMQTYVGIDSPSFAGGAGHDLADLFLYPSERSCELERARYGKPAIAVGVPKLDAWAQVPKPENDPPVIAITAHWDQRASMQVPEAGTCFPEWRETIEALAKIRPVIGHAHPRARRELEPWWRSIGVEFVPNAYDLLARCDRLVVDNSSIAYEWAALDRPVVFLRGSNWTDVAHGLRFGEELPGPELSQPCSAEQLAATLDYASTEAWVSTRAEVAERVYGGFPDGLASVRAAQAILTLMG